MLATGTNDPGLNSVQDGDTLELECTGLGHLAVKVRDELERIWPHETRGVRRARPAPPLQQLFGKYAKVGLRALLGVQMQAVRH